MAALTGTPLGTVKTRMLGGHAAAQGHAGHRPARPGRHGRAPDDRRGDPAADDHDSWDELAVGWALHALEPEDETLFAAHLADCPGARRPSPRPSEVMAAMAGDLPPAEPSEGLRDAAARRGGGDRAAAAAPPRGRAAPAAAGVAAPTPPAAAGDLDVRAPLPLRAVDGRPAWRRVLPTALVAAAVAAVLSLGAWNVV